MSKHGECILARRSAAVLILLAAVCGAGRSAAQAPGAPSAAPGSFKSVHQLQLEQHRHDPPAVPVLPQAEPEPLPPNLTRAVYGYYPFWVQDLSTIRFAALSHLAWFSVEMNSTGEIDALHGWPDSVTVTAAHAASVRVDLAFTLFSAAGIEALCTSPSRRATAIGNMVDLLEAGDADGIAVDFEGLNAAVREPFVTFMAELRAELDVRGHQDAEISIAGPAVDWSDAVDLDALLDHISYYFVMGYDYFWSGSGHAGPVGMLRVTEDWAAYQSRSAVRSIAHYSRLVGPEKRRQIIWGVPYYGREWTTTSSAPGATTISNIGSVTYSQALNDLAGGQVREYLEGVENPWYRWQQSGTWHQIYYDDAESLAAKYDLALAQDLGGIGIWALNYDAPHPELWDLIEETFTSEPPTPEGHRHNPIVINAYPFHDERDTTVGASHYFNYYSCAPDTPEYGREWVYRIDVCQPGTIIAAVPLYGDRDPDLHLLSEPYQDACIARADTDLSVAVEPGRYLLVVDTWVNTPVEQEGPYELDVDFAPEPGSQGCADYLVCEAGSCLCPTAGELLCAGSCVDAQQSPEHCGECDHPCAAGEACVAGACQPDPDGEGGAGGAGGASGGVTAGLTGDDGGCSCRVVAPRPALPAGWLLFGLGFGALTLRSRPRRR